MTRLLTGQCHLKGPLLKLGLLDSPRCDRCKQASETASHFFCDYEALLVLWFRHLGCHFLKSVEFANIFISKILKFVESEGLLNPYAMDSTKNKKQLRWKLYCHAHLMYSSLLYSTQLCSALLYRTIVYWLYCTLLFCTLLHSALLWSAVLYYSVLNCTLLYSILLYSALLCYAVLCSAVLYSTLPYSTLLYSTLLSSPLFYSAVLYYTFCSLKYQTYNLSAMF